MTDELPSPLWALIMIGAVDLHYLNLVFSYAKFEDAYLDDCLFSALIGLMVFMVAALDNPYRGKISVSPEPLGTGVSPDGQSAPISGTNTMSLDHRTALVTGASKGVGKGIALALGEAGCNVAVNYFSDAHGADDTVSELERWEWMHFLFSGMSAVLSM